MAYQIFLNTRTKTLILSCHATPTRRRGTSSALWRLIEVAIVAAFLNCISVSDVWAQTYRGRVVDAETGQPLEGAVFVIVWNKKLIVTMNGSRTFHSAKEAMTDEKGEFSVGGSPGIDWNPFTYVVEDPSIAIFMPGHGPFPRGHVREVSPVETEKAMRGTGAVIKLPRLKSQQEMRQYGGLGGLGIPSDTPYEKIPNLIRLINIHRKLAGVSSELGTPSR